jgi:uncharacterized protein (TIGR00730 family)
MHERKARMAELADGFVALPGGLGTYEELFEIWTWAQLGWHRKPCGLLNLNHYYDHLIAFFDHAVRERFFSPENRSMILIEEEPQRLLDQLRIYKAPRVEKWIDERDT